MREPGNSLFQQQYERLLSRQRAQVETAKLVATFATAVGATIVGSALQVVRGSTLTVLASSLLAAAFLVTVIIVAFDRLAEPNLDPAVIKLFSGHAAFQEYVESQLIASEDFNTWRLAQLRILIAIQLILAASSGAVAAVSLLSG